MMLNPLLSESADFCPVCSEMTVLRWSDGDLNESICEDCAECLANAKYALAASSLGHPSPDLIDRNP